MSNHDVAIKELKKRFGNQNLDQDVIVAVLEMHGGDLNQTIQFLEAQGNDYVEPAPNANSLPNDYMTKPLDYSEVKLKEVAPEISNPMRVKNFFLQENTSLVVHLNEFKEDPQTYSSVIITLLYQGVALSLNNKSKALAVSWIGTKDHKLFEFLLGHKQFGFSEVLRALKVLDAPRKVKSYNKKIALLEKNGKTSKKAISKLKKMVHNFGQDCSKDQKTTVSGALSRRIKAWISTLSESQLLFFALQMPKEPWKELADIIHCSPKDFNADWFLPFVFGTALPADSVVSQCSTIAELEGYLLLDLIQTHKIPYSFIRTKLPNGLEGENSIELKKAIARYETLETILWYYEELSNGSQEVDNIIGSRLDSGEEPQFNYGKFMERLLYFKQLGSSFYPKLIPAAEKRLGEIKLPLEPPVVVFGDASYSMDVAIRTSTIIASLLTALCDADLRFFNVESYAPPLVPRKVVEVLDVALNTRADGLTAPACSIREYYIQKKIIKCMIIVTDEIENEPSQNFFFAQLFYKYYTEVYPCKIVFVSFLDDPKKKGRMVNALESFGIIPLQFRLDTKRPDLTKLDTLFGLLASETFGFTERINSIVNSMKENGINEVINNFSMYYSLSSADVDAEKIKIEEREAKQKEEEAEQQEKRANIKECSICQERDVDTALVDCGHLICSFCGINLKTCPFCRKEIKGTLKIYAP